MRTRPLTFQIVQRRHNNHTHKTEVAQYILLKLFNSIKPILNRVSKTQTKLARMQEQHKGSHHLALNTHLRQVDKFTTELSKGLKDEVIQDQTDAVARM